MKTETNTAARILDAARAANPDGPTGVARSGACVVTYHRPSGGPSRRHTYEIGTDALSIYIGRASGSTPYIEAILAGNVTRAECDAWIARLPVVASR